MAENMTENAIGISKMIKSNQLRRYQWPNGRYFRLHLLHCGLFRVNMFRRNQCNCDRFIPLRLSTLEQHEYDVYKDKNSVENEQKKSHDSVFSELKILQQYPDSFVNLARTRYNRINYENIIRSTFFPYEYKTLNFFPSKKRPLASPFINQTPSWPVVSRNKPTIGRPVSVYDSPQIGSATMQMFDWSSTNWVSFIFQGEVHMCRFEPENLNSHMVTSTERRVDSFIKWNDNGGKLAMRLKSSRLGIWDLRSNKIIKERPCCHPIISLKWCGNYLITVCEQGKLYLRFDDLVIKNQIKLACEEIGSVEISSARNYLTTIGVSRILRIRKLPELSQYYQIKTDSFIRCIAWHPCHEHLLIVANTRLSLWNLEKKRKECDESGHSDDYYADRLIDSLTFNPKSAELVMNCRIFKSDNTAEKSCICVMSNINLIVEELYLHIGRILYLMWSPDSNMLASAGIDENMFIWEFFKSKRPYCNAQNTNNQVF